MDTESRPSSRNGLGFYNIQDVKTEFPPICDLNLDKLHKLIIYFLSTFNFVHGRRFDTNVRYEYKWNLSDVVFAVALDISVMQT